MEQWDETSEKVSRIRPDAEKAKALLKMTELREQLVKRMPLPQF